MTGMSGSLGRTPATRIPIRPPWRAAGRIVALTTSALLLLGCSGRSADPPGSDRLLLSGPATDVLVAIPAGWHQVINSADPTVPEMLAPTTCMGAREVSCSLALARTATLTAQSPEAAAQIVEQAVTGTRGVTRGATITQGPGAVGRHDGYRHRFTFSNPGARLTAEIAAVPSGSTAPDGRGEREYSVILVWVSDRPGAPRPEVIDEIVDSALVAGGAPPS